VPIFSTVLPPLVDYPNHMARMHLLTEGGNAYYAVRWAPLPDLAVDLIVPALARAMPLALAGKLFLVITFALIAGGTLWLNRVAGRCWHVWPLLAFLLLYNRSFLWGFLNYLFGLGLAVCGLALWLVLEDRPVWLRVVASSTAALACFFSHVAAFGVYALVVFGVEIGPALGELRSGRYRALGRRVAIAAPQIAIPASLLLWVVPAEPSGQIVYGQIWRKADMLFSVFDNYSRPFDIACFALFLLLVGGLAWRRQLACHPRLGGAALMILAAYLVLPNQIFSGSGLDHRLPPALFLVLIAATTPRLGDRRFGAAIAVVVIAVFAVRTAVIETVWLRADAVYADDIAAIDRLPQGAKLAVAYPARAVNAGGIPQLHAATLAAWRREAFVPTLFAFPTQQPIALRAPYEALAAATSPTELWSAFVDGDAAARIRIAPLLQNYDFIVFADRDAVVLPEYRCLRALPSPSNFRLYALEHAASCAEP
jgi:hypothetical protein